MQFLPDKTRSNSGSKSSSQSTGFKPTSGWETAVDEFDSENEQKIINAANNIFLLDQAFLKHKVKLEQTYSARGWTFKGQCPFDDHNDRTPSFGYNPSANVFNCFGCHRSGKAVEFLSYKEGRNKLNVAKEIIDIYKTDDFDIDQIVGFDLDKLKQILFEYADYVLSFKRRHDFSKKCVKYAEAINWNIDVFLAKNNSLIEIDLSNLEARILKLKEQFELFEDTI